MIVIGLDISTKTGISVQSQEGDKLCHFTYEKSFPKLTGIARVQAFFDWIHESLTDYRPDLVVIEGYGFNHMSSIVTVVEIGTVIRLMCHHLQIPYVEVSPNMLKKFACGSGTAKKEEVMMKVYKNWDFEAKTNNEADAFVLGRIGLVLKGVLAPANQYQKEVKEKIAV